MLFSTFTPVRKNTTEEHILMSIVPIVILNKEGNAKSKPLDDF